MNMLAQAPFESEIEMGNILILLMSPLLRCLGAFRVYSQLKLIGNEDMY
jgi:hypothetical protein